MVDTPPCYRLRTGGRSRRAEKGPSWCWELSGGTAAANSLGQHATWLARHVGVDCAGRAVGRKDICCYKNMGASSNLGARQTETGRKN